MNVLIVGSGGREHALAWKISTSPLVDKLYCAPGNPGIAQVAECVAISVMDSETLANFAQQHDVGLTVIGPENPLAKGVVDHFRRRGLRAFGPSASAATLEASKSFAKDLMSRQSIPTGAYESFTEPAKAMAYVNKVGAPIVIKADGLAAGKGVTVARSVEEAKGAIESIMVDRAYGDAGGTIVIEECLVGEEASIFAFSDGKDFLMLASSQDHKPLSDGDKGPNTGGMGAYSPAPVVTPDILQDIEQRIIAPCIQGMADQGRPYTGVLYAGLMITQEGPKVIEFNCRFGDPETQVVLPRMKSDIVPIMVACCDGTLADFSVEWGQGACVTVVMASGGYPGLYDESLTIRGISQAESMDGIQVFQAGTRKNEFNGELVTHGGRVLNVTATGADIGRAIKSAYQAVAKITFEGAHYRTDIGHKALDRLAD